MIELLLALHCFSKVVFGMETKIGEIKMRATAGRRGPVVCMYIRGCQLDDTGPKAFPKRSHICKFGVPTGSIKNILDRFTYNLLKLRSQICKIKTALKYKICLIETP